jgi:hypothetical protein
MRAAAVALALLAATVAFAGCFGADDAPAAQTVPVHEITHTVQEDDALAAQARVEQIRSVTFARDHPEVRVGVVGTPVPDPRAGDGDPDRPIIVGSLADLTVSHFLAGEVVVASDARIDRLPRGLSVASPGGLVELWTDSQVEVVQTLEPPRGSGLPMLTLLRFPERPPPSDHGALPARLAALDARQSVELAFAHAEDMDLLAAVLDVKELGLDASFNWIGEGHGIGDIALPADTFFDGVSNEDADGPGGYDRNAFTWTEHRADGLHGIGTSAAWRVLEGLGRLDEKVTIAIVDGGFDAGLDLPGATVLSAVVELDDDEVLGTPNFGTCSGGNPCPWHGLHVAEAAFSAADNGWGAVGSGGPVADRMFIFTDYSLWSTLYSLHRAWFSGADIVNLSYSTSRAFGSWSDFIGTDAYTNAMRTDGVLIFASAGNSNTTVDGIQCFVLPAPAGSAQPPDVVCNEVTWTSPCENAGVFCVGGLSTSSLAKHPSSSWGVGVPPASLPPNTLTVIRDPGSVDLFALYTQSVTQDPDTGTPGTVQLRSGTSYSSPFVAGVAALYMRAQPTWSADQIEQALLDNARPTFSAQAPLLVQVAAPFISWFCPSPPDITITSPVHQSHHEQGELVQFSLVGTAHEPATVVWKEATAFQPETFSTSPAWSRDDLGPGLYTINAVVTDLCGQTDQATLQVTIDPFAPGDDVVNPTPDPNQPPTIAITAPEDGAAFGNGEAVALAATASDPEDGPLTGAAIVWSVQYGAAPVAHVGTGEEARHTLDGCGAVRFTARATDSDGASASDSVTITSVCPQ